MLNTPDKKLVIMVLYWTHLHYYSKKLCEVDWKFGIAYGDDVENFKKAINDFIAEDSRILKDPANLLAFLNTDSSVNFTVRYGLTR
jgi:small conductance mechanosensitive channel